MIVAVAVEKPLYFEIGFVLQKTYFSYITEKPAPPTMAVRSRQLSSAPIPEPPGDLSGQIPPVLENAESHLA
jgi:hypothetical protein